MQIRILKDYEDYRKGDVVDVAPKVADGLIASDVARVDKMLTTHNTAALTKTSRRQRD